MKRIRSKLVPALLVVALIPVLPSYYMANGLVNHILALGFNETVEQAIDGAIWMSAKLHQQREAETVDIAKRLAHSDPVARAPAGNTHGQVAADQVSSDSTLVDLASYRLELYDTEARLVASHAYVADGAAAAESDPLSADLSRGVTITVDDTQFGDLEGEVISGLLAALVDFDEDLDPRFYRDSLAVLATRQETQLLFNEDDPRLITVLAPVPEATLGFIVLTRLLPPEHGRTMWQLGGLQELFQAIDEHQSQIQTAMRVVFWLFYVFAAFIALVIGDLLSRRLTRPLLALVDGTQKVAAGDLDYRLDVASKDEIGELMVSFNKMITQIKVTQRLATERCRLRMIVRQ